MQLDEETIKRDLGKVLLKLEKLQDKTIADAQAIRQEKIEITDCDKAAALELLKSENLLDKFIDDFEGCGVVGERTNKLVGYLAATSLKLERPLSRPFSIPLIQFQPSQSALIARAEPDRARA